MNFDTKKRIVFSCIMGVISTGIISFTLIAINIGFTENFLVTWAKSWLIAYVIVIPVILLVAPLVQGCVDRYITE